MDVLDFGPFQRLRPDVRAQLATKAREVRVERGEKVIWEKSAGSGCYVLLEGALRVVTGPEERTLRELRPPALVGEVAPVRRSARTASVLADAPSRLLFINVIDLHEAMADDPGFAQALREHIDQLMGGGAPTR